MVDQNRKWLVVALMFGVEFFGGSFYGAWGVFFNPLLHYLHISRAQLGFLPGVMMLVTYGLAPVGGWLLDRIAGRWVVGIGLLVVAGSLLLCAGAQSFRFLVIATLILAVGFSCTVAVGVPATLISRWFDQRRGLAIGLAFAGFTLGSSAMLQVCNYVIHHFGWRWAFITISIPIALMVPLAFWLLGHPPVHGAPSSTSAQKTLAEAPAELPGLEVREAVAARTFWLFNTMLLFYAIEIGAFMVHAVTNLIGLGLSSAAAAMTLSLGFLLATAAKPTFGFLADRWSARGTLAICYLCNALACVSLIWGNVTAFWILFIVGFGLGQVSVVPLQTLAAETYGVRRYGTLCSLNNTLLAAGELIGPIVAGLIFDRYGSYAPMWSACAVLALISAILPFGCVRFAPPTIQATPLARTSAG